MQSLITAAFLGAGSSTLIAPTEDFDVSESAGDYINNFVQSGRVCSTTFTRLYADQPDVFEVAEGTTKFTDTSFLKAEALMGAETVHYRRTSEVYPESEGYSLFKDNRKAGISFHDISQGGLGDCWVLAAMGAIAEFPERIYNMFDVKKINESGIYSIKMYELGVPVSVIVDDFVPVRAHNNKAMQYQQVTTEKELWPALLEKAFAKLHGNYQAINGGLPTHAVDSMLGTDGVVLRHEEKTEQELWDWIKRHDAIRTIMMCDTPPVASYGLIAAHAYSTLGHVELSNGVRLVKVRNPWGNEHYTGPWNDKDPQWTEQFKKEAGMVNANNGTFYIPINYFKQGFANSYINQDPSNWHLSYFLSLDNKELGVPGELHDCGAECKKNVFTIESDSDQKVHMSMNLHKARGYITRECRKAALGVHVAQLYDGDKLIQHRAFNHFKAVFEPREMVKGQKLTVVFHANWTTANIQADFALSIWGEESKVQITHMQGAQSDHYPLQTVTEDEEPEPQPEPKPQPKPEPKPEPKPDDGSFTFEDFADEQAHLKPWCSAGIQIVDTKQNDQKAIVASHNCESYKLKIYIAMTADDFQTRVLQVTEEHQFQVEKCRIDSTGNVACIFVIEEGQANALGIMMKSDWSEEMRYRYVWVPTSPHDDEDEPVAEFEKDIDEATVPHNHCNGGIEIMDLGDNKAIYAGHTCKGYMMKVNLAMSLKNYRLVKQVTAEYDFDLSSCKVDSGNRTLCTFVVPEGQKNALGLRMGSGFSPYLRYSTEWIRGD